MGRRLAQPSPRSAWIDSGDANRSTKTMKIRPVLSAILLAIPLPCPAEEPNPFLNQEPKKPSPEPSGDSFVSLTEHILVPADQLDGWLEKHPLTDDASGLRTAAQTWIAEGTAHLDHTAVSTGISGRESANNSIWEQTYATEYEPPGPGEWPPPTAFETRNLGYEVSASAGIEHGALILRARMDYTGIMLPHHSWNELAERTRQPDDVFIPRFRSVTVERMVLDAAGNQIYADPFAAPPKVPAGSRDLRFDPGKTYLASRSDNDLPEPFVSKIPDLAKKTPQAPPSHLARLIFFRGAILDTPAARQAETPEIHHLSVKLIRVNHKTFSDWVQSNDLSKIPDLAWPAAVDWENNGAAATTVNLTAANHSGSTCNIENLQKVTYPTEWKPGKRLPASDGKRSQLEFSHGCAFDTRNVGTTLQAEVVADPKGSLVKFGLKRVVEGGKSVHHRILRDGEWKADITIPIFSSNAWESELRLKRGEWMLVGSGCDIDAKGKLDPNQAVLAFIKLD